MSLTGAFDAFASIDERGVNRAFTDFFTARPHYLHYGSAPFVAASSISSTQVSAIAFPGVPGGIPYAVDLTIPVVDLFPPNAPLPAPLVMNPDELSITTTASITLGCQAGKEQRGDVSPVTTDLDVIAIGKPLSAFLSPGVGWVSFQITQVLVEGITPATLQSVVDCLLEMILNAVLSGVELPFNLIDVEFFKLSLDAGPTIADNQIKIWGEIS
jgi:hypothetical protein